MTFPASIADGVIFAGKSRLKLIYTYEEISGNGSGHGVCHAFFPGICPV